MNIRFNKKSSKYNNKKSKFKWFLKNQNKRGGAELFEVVISMFIVTFVLFYPIANYNIILKRNLLEDTKTLALQMASTRGGVTTEVLNTIYSDAQAKGLQVKSSTGTLLTGSDGLPILKVYVYNAKTGASGVQGVTPASMLSYKTDADATIHIKVTYPATDDMALLNAINKLVGISSTATKFEYKAEGYILSEKINY